MLIDGGKSAEQIEAITVEEAAGRLRVSKPSVYRAIRSGELRARKFGSRTLILIVDWNDFLKKLPLIAS